MVQSQMKPSFGCVSMMFNPLLIKYTQQQQQQQQQNSALRRLLGAGQRQR